MALADFVDVLFVKQRRVFLSVLLVTLGIAVAVTFLLPKQYSATATLVVGENRPVATGSNSVPLDQVLVQNYRELLGTPAVTHRVANRLHMPAGELAGKMSFGVVTGTYLINVTAADRQPGRAAEVANAYATTFVTMNQRAAGSRDATRLSSLNQDIANLSLQIARLRNSSDPRDAARALVAQNRLAVDRDTVSALTQNDTLQGKNIALATAAIVPNSPSQPKPKLYLTLGIVLALLLAIGGSLVANSLDSAMRDGSEIEKLLGAPTLALIPSTRRPRSPYWRLPQEPLQFLRTNLDLLREADGPLSVLSVVGAAPGEGKSAIVAELSQTLARAGSTVIAIDADTHRPTLAKAFGLARHGPGLTDVLSGQAVPRNALQLHESGVRVLPAGSTPPNPALLFKQGHLSEVLTAAREHADYIVIDTPPILASPETSIISTMVDGVLFVVNVEASKRRNLAAAREQLAKANTRVIGVILNRVPRRLHDYYYPYHEGEQALNGDRIAALSGARKEESLD